MSKRPWILAVGSSVLFSAMVLGFAAEPQNQAWSMQLELRAPGLTPEVVQWAIFDEDPMEAFESSLRSMKDFYEEQISKATDEKEKERIRLAQIRVSWDSVFRKVTGDKVYLLWSAPGSGHGFSSTSAPAKRWVATKVRDLTGTPLCWCLPISPEAGKSENVVLTKENAAEVSRIYGEVLATK